jgi:hypothetical protein
LRLKNVIDCFVKHYPVQIAAMKERLAGYRADIQTYAQNKFPDKDTFSIKIGNRVYTGSGACGEAETPDRVKCPFKYGRKGQRWD